MAYDPDNVFAKILRGDIPCDRVDEDEHCLAFRDIAPQAPQHILVIPKSPHADFDAFADGAEDAAVVALIRMAARIARREGLAESGYRLIVNTGGDAHQEVPHLHIHILGGRPLGPMLTDPGAR